MTKTVSITLPAPVLIRTVAGKAWNVDFASFGDEALQRLLPDLIAGASKIVLNNVWNGGGKDKPDAERLAAMERRVKAWAEGSYITVEREGGSRVITVAFDEYVASMAEKNGMDAGTMRKHLEGMVASTFGKDTKASADNIVNAICTALAKESKTDLDSERTAWEATWFPVAEAKMAEAEASKAKLQTAGIALTLK